MLNKKTNTQPTTTASSGTTAKPAPDTHNSDHQGELSEKSERSEKSEKSEKSESRRRFKEVWLVEDRREGKAFWTRVGTAFENRDGSWNLRLSAVPVGSGNLNIRDPRPAEAQVAA